VRTGANVVRSNVALKVAGVREHFTAILAGILADFSVTEGSMALKAGSPGKGSRAQLTLVLVGRVTMIRYKVLVQPVSHTKHFICTVCKLNVRFFSFIVEPYIDKNIINSNQLMHIFIKKHIKIM